MDMPNVTVDYDTMLRGVKRALGLRDRYTILFYLRDRGLFERYAECATKSVHKRLI